MAALKSVSKAPSSFKSVGENVQYQVDGDYLVLRIKYTERLRPSGSGKSTLIGTTGGAALIEGTDGVKATLTVYLPD